ncbi:hypothetical protein ABGB12_32250 [Actinocorallia sp. B10E7]|uniref:hypothetical protein n=1 Tax=Actinocorallia sp. B10E7 TaxID=3153558 RepID=UPI00325C483A
MSTLEDLITAALAHDDDRALWWELNAFAKGLYELAERRSSGGAEATGRLADGLRRVVAEYVAGMPVPSDAPEPPAAQVADGQASEEPVTDDRAAGESAVSEKSGEEPAFTETSRPTVAADPLGRLRTELGTVSRGLVRSTAADPARVWEHLHAACWWVEEETARRCLGLLHEQVSPETGGEWLVTPHPGLGVEGVSLGQALRPDAILGLNELDRYVSRDDWETRLAGLLDAVGLAWTLSGLGEGLFYLKGKDIAPIDVADYRERLLGRVGFLARQTGAALKERDPAKMIPALVNLDEALRLFFPYPFPAERSPWSARLRESHRLVAAEIGQAYPDADPLLITPGRSVAEYEESGYLSKDDEFPLQEEGRGADDESNGHVLWPLRVGYLPAAKRPVTAAVISRHWQGREPLPRRDLLA